jgi:hypothetical protein
MLFQYRDGFNSSPKTAPHGDPTNGHPEENDKLNVEKYVSKYFCREFIGFIIKPNIEFSCDICKY